MPLLLLVSNEEKPCVGEFEPRASTLKVATEKELENAHKKGSDITRQRFPAARAVAPAKARF